MLTLEQAVTIQILHQQCKSIKAISRELGVSRNTVRKYLRQNTTPQYQRIQPRISILDPYKPGGVSKSMLVNSVNREIENK